MRNLNPATLLTVLAACASDPTPSTNADTTGHGTTSAASEGGSAASSIDATGSMTTATPGTTGACDAAPVLPDADDEFLLGLAGVPQGTFGDVDAPDFAGPFASLAADGFNRFVPVFLTDESGAGTAEITYFVPSEFSGAPPSSSCSGPSNPWLVDSPMGVVLPGYLVVPEVQEFEVLDEALVVQRMNTFVDVCLAGDTSRIAAHYLYDEPANRYAVSRVADDDPNNDAVIENVETLAAGSRAVVDAPAIVIEAPLPLLATFLDFGPDQAALERQWNAGVAASAPVADIYGFDFYAVDLTDDFSGSGTIVDDAIAWAPQALPVAVVQGFGYADQGIALGSTGRRPTEQEVRANAFMAVAHGARGVFWYGQSGLTLAPADLPLWEAIRQTGRDIRQLSGALALPELPIDVDNPQVAARALGDATASLVVLVNPTPQPQSVVVPGTGPVTEALSGAPVGVGALQLELPPHGVATLWRTAPCG